MPIYARAVKATDNRFKGREIHIVSAGRDGIHESRIPVPDSTVLCDGCNTNIPEGYLVYLGKRELAADQPYDIFCPPCLRRYFPKAKEV